MSRQHHLPQKPLLLVFLVLTLVFVAGSDQQCSQVNDRVTGIESASGGAKSHGISECVKACVREAKARRTEEQELHRANIVACHHDRECLREENQRHEAEMVLIAMDEKACKVPCHEQGGGRGGQ